MKVNPVETWKKIWPVLNRGYKRTATFLNYRNEWELLVAVILSAQMTDDGVNAISDALFERFPNPESMAGATISEITKYVKKVNYYNAKSQYLQKTAQMIVEQFNGKVPDTAEDLMKLSGVRENAQTYRLGWTEVCRDSTKIGVGLPEYILLFRKPPTSRESAQADDPVEHSKDHYTRGRWQIDAHAFWRSSGNRLLTPADFVGAEVDAATIFQRFAAWSSLEVYDYENHVGLCEALDAAGKLPPSFMLLQPQSHSADAWTDVARMRTLNTLQAAQDRVKHLCPMQFDIADRLVERFTNPGEIVFDPFAGLGTVPLRAMRLGRKGLGTELNPVYWREALRYLRAEERAMSTPTLFDLGPVATRRGQEDRPSRCLGPPTRWRCRSRPCIAPTPSRSRSWATRRNRLGT
jgi:hypothetical protein